MNAFDTLKLAFPSELLSVHRKHNDQFLHSERTSPDTGVVVTRYTLKPEVIRTRLGLGELSYDSRGGALLVLSAKSLLGSYADGITNNNIESAIRSALPTWVECDTSELVERADVFRADVTENVPTSLGVETTLSELAQWEHDTQRFHRKTWGRKRVGTVEWGSMLKSDNTRMIAYDKQAELSKRSQLAYAPILKPERFDGMVRIELNLRSHKAVRTAFGLGKGVPRLTEILASSERALAKGYDTILPHRQRAVSAMRESHSMAEARDRVFFQTLFEESNWEWRIAEHRLRAFYGKRSNPTRILRKARTWYELLDGERGHVALGEVERIRTYLHSA